MEDEIDLIVQDEKEKTYISEVSKRISYRELKDKVNEKIIKNEYKFDIIYKKAKI